MSEWRSRRVLDAFCCTPACNNLARPGDQVGREVGRPPIDEDGVRHWPDRVREHRFSELIVRSQIACIMAGVNRQPEWGSGNPHRSAIRNLRPAARRPTPRYQRMNVLHSVERIQQRATNLKVYDQVRDALVAGRFRPGTR